MAYIGESISDEDYIKYDLRNINRRWLPRTNYIRTWVIDRERDIWLKQCYKVQDRENSWAELSRFWDFCWKGTLILIETKNMRKESQKEGELYMYFKILNIVTTGQIRWHKEIEKEQDKILIDFPQELLPHKDEILKELREAFEANYRYMYSYSSRIKSCKVDFEYEGELI
jgi:hypothetical protein